MRDWFTQEVAEIGLHASITFVQSKIDLIQAFSGGKFDLLLSFQTGVIVPTEILQIEGLMAINVHAASPDYPGRDPHHFAVYDSVTEYGATMHYMTSKVDAGPIIAVELFPVKSRITPSDLMDLANQSAFILIRRLAASLKDGEKPSLDDSLTWRGLKRTRKDFLELCNIDPKIDEEEFTRRYFATQSPHHCNLTTIIHGHKFRIEPA